MGVGQIITSTTVNVKGNNDHIKMSNIDIKNLVKNKTSILENGKIEAINDDAMKANDEGSLSKSSQEPVEISENFTERMEVDIFNSDESLTDESGATLITGDSELIADNIKEVVNGDANLSSESLDSSLSKSFEIGMKDTSNEKKLKIKRRSNLDRQLETNLTTKITLPTSPEPGEGDASGLNTSRYGRARKQKTIDGFYRTEIALSRTFGAVLKSPAKTPMKQKSPLKITKPSPVKMSSPLKNKSLNGDLDGFSSGSGSGTLWNESSHKNNMKVYVRKDLIQRKKEQKEETVNLMRCMFSPTKSPISTQYVNGNRSTDDDTSPVMIKSEEKKKKVVKRLSLKKAESNDKTVVTNCKSQPVEGVSDICNGDSGILADMMERPANADPAKVENVCEVEANCSWKLGDLAWARVGSHPFWPCLITRDPVCSMFVRKKTVGRSIIPVEVLHVTFFADCGRRSWLLCSLLMPFTGQDDFNKARADLSPQMKKNNPKYCAAFNVTQPKMSKWLSAVSEAEMLLRRPLEVREHCFITTFLAPAYIAQKTEKPKKEKKIKIKPENKCNVSLSESLFDSLFDEPVAMPADKKGPLACSKKNNIDVSELVSACLDNIAAKSGNVKIKTQSHMDRWLMKAKQPSKDTPNEKSISVATKEVKRSARITKLIPENVESSKQTEGTSLVETEDSVLPKPSADATDKVVKTVDEMVVVETCDNAEQVPVTDVKQDNDSLSTPIQNETVEDSVIVAEGALKENEPEQIVLEKVDQRKESPEISTKVSIEENVDEPNESSKASPKANVEEKVDQPKESPKASPKANIGERSDPVWERSIVFSHDSDSDFDVEETCNEEVKADNSKAIKTKADQKYDDPEFQQFLELNRDSLEDENPGWTEDVIMTHFYKMWLYNESRKGDEVKRDEDFCLVGGMLEEVPIQPRKPRVRNREVNTQPRNESPILRGKSSRKKSIKDYMIEQSSEESDNEDNNKKDLKASNKSNETNSESGPSKSGDVKVVRKYTKQIKAVSDDADEDPDLDWRMAELTVQKPNIFKGLLKEKVCELCELPSNLLKCKGSCGSMFHAACVQKQNEPSAYSDKSLKGRKKKRKRSHMHVAKKKSSLDTTSEDVDTSRVDSGDEEQGDDASNPTDDTASKEGNRVVRPNLQDEVEIPPSPGHSSKKIKNDLNESLLNADNFEAQLAEKMKEMMESTAHDELSQDLDASSASSTAEDCDWDDVQAGQCVIVDVKIKKSNAETAEKIEPPVSAETFKCNDCVKYDLPVCFVCKSLTSPKTSSDARQKCSVIHCNKVYHLECLAQWPQTKYSTGAPSKSSKSPHMEAMSCPRHVCHTCVCDDPQGSRTRFSGDKLARCVRCPATYHCFTQCVPAGSKIITASQIVCPRHRDVKPAKTSSHVNTSWCFICAKGGSLICCETCPTSFHAECLNISPPEGGYICEDCETGRLPLYGELVWVKLGQYRWWPALVLHPSEVPPNVAAVQHQPGQFVVRFFGDYDHYWVSSGRVFPYQEGDTGHASTKKSAVDCAFLTAVKQAQEAYAIIQNLKQQNSDEGELQSSLLPPQYIKLKVNRAVRGAAIGGRSAQEGGAARCDCSPTAPNPCAPDTDCLNRMLLTECSPSVCAAGTRCGNQAFEKRQYPPLAPCRTSFRGWGLKTLADVKKGEFVIEYVGEVIDEVEFQRRMARRQEVRDENYYFLTLDKDRMIDAGPKGNVARFMNHSCEPNCETQKWTVNGDTRVGLFALEDIPADSEVTFNYNLYCAGDDKKKCLCGAKRCGGFIGAKPKQDDPLPKKGKILKKRKYRKKAVANSPSTSSQLKSKPGTSERRRISSPPVEEPPKADTSWIDNDLEVINKAIADVESRDESLKMEVKSYNIATKKMLNGTMSCGVKLEDIKYSQKNMSAYKCMTNGIGKSEITDEFIFCEGDSKHSSKRKRLSLASPDVKSPNATISKLKRLRSNSVHFSESITYMEYDGSVLSDKKVLNGSHIGEELSPGKNFIDAASFKLKSNKLLNGNSPSQNKTRGRPRKVIETIVKEI